MSQPNQWDQTAPASLPLVIRASPKAWRGMLVLSIVLVLLCVFTLFLDPADSVWKLSPGVARGIAIFGIVFFGAGVGLALAKLRQKEPEAVIDAEGIIDNTMQSGVGRIPWSEIAGLEFRPSTRQPFLKVYLRDPDAVIARLSGRKAAVAKINLRAGGTPINIVMGQTDPKPETVMATVRAIVPGLIRE